MVVHARGPGTSAASASVTCSRWRTARPTPRWRRGPSRFRLGPAVPLVAHADDRIDEHREVRAQLTRSTGSAASAVPASKCVAAGGRQVPAGREPDDADASRVEPHPAALARTVRIARWASSSGTNGRPRGSRYSEHDTGDHHGRLATARCRCPSARSPARHSRRRGRSRPPPRSALAGRWTVMNASACSNRPSPTGARPAHRASLSGCESPPWQRSRQAAAPAPSTPRGSRRGTIGRVASELERRPPARHGSTP